MKTILLFLFSFQMAFAVSLSDKTAIYKSVDKYVDAWNNHSGKGFTDTFTADTDFINIFAMHFHGKEAVEERHIEILDGFLKDTTFIVTNRELKEVGQGVVIAYVSWEVKKDPDLQMKGIFSHVLIKEEGTWKITSTQNTLCRGAL
ncbi:MAG: hypothetical protein SP4CHLAM5_03980 [Chlamydiia bacterium]|nr:hypothetical protein [Chlamydiia bacterium]MCH9618271.1 hypothetical protein [Chlamydiia bacterium]MCH9624761.1 hypothetical protein [Chlamydiia bacterium]